MVSRDLFLALLAMDPYNRGYGQGTTTSSDDGISNVNEISRLLGKARIIRQSDVAPQTDGVDAGFYAIAYDVSNVEGFGDDEIVIAYRGSDYDPDVYADIFLGCESSGQLPLWGR